MRWLVTGSHGLLGTDLVARLEEAGETVTRAPREALLGQASVEKLVAGQDVVVNCAAWTDVDGAESAGIEPFLVNGHIPELLTEATRRTDARLVQLSTDYVFSGTAKRPYREDARTAPRSVYGRSKLAGENEVLAGHPTGGFVVRTAWLYGAHGPCFPRTIARIAAE
ncbi:MAG: SDR family oxidoreductase, partial [Nocardioidaceae bacterium]